MPPASKSAHCGILDPTVRPCHPGQRLPQTLPVLISLTDAQWPTSLAPVRLPALDAWCARRQRQSVAAPGESDLTTPAERWRARALGLTATPMGDLPWAAWHAARLGLTGQPPWALISPCHWLVSMNEVRLDDPALLALENAHSQALMAALEPLARDDGITLHWIDALHWLAQGQVFADLSSPSPAAAAAAGELLARLPQVAQNPAATGVLRRLQNEAQMLFYQHPVYDQRAAAGLCAVNSIWYHGCGALNDPVRQAAQTAPPQDWREWSLRSLLQDASGDIALAWRLADQHIGQVLREHPDSELLVTNARGGCHWGPHPLAWWRPSRLRRAASILAHLG